MVSTSISALIFLSIEHRALIQFTHHLFPLTHLIYPLFYTPIPILSYNTTNNSFVSSGEPNILVQSLTTKETVGTINTDATGVKTFQLNSDNTYMGVVNCKGKLLLININKSSVTSGIITGYTSTQVGEFAIVPSSAASKDSGCQISWSPSHPKPLLAVPSHKGACVLLDMSEPTDAKEVILACDPSVSPMSHADCDLNLASFSPDGNFLATADLEGNVLIWKINADLNKSEPVKMFADSSKSPLMNIVWGTEADDNYIIVSNRDGWEKLTDVISSEMKNDNKNIDEEVVTSVAGGVEEEKASSGESNKKRRLIKSSTATVADDDEEMLFDDGEGEDTTNGVADSQSQEDDDSTNNLESISAIKKSNTVVLGDDENDDIPLSDDADIANEWKKNKSNHGLEDVDARIQSLEETRTNSNMSIQQPFQPSCTKEDDKQRRYLAWNNIGNITLRSEPENEQNRIEIRFTDTMGVNKQEAFADVLGFNMAALSNEGAIFATDIEAVDDMYHDPSGSKVHYHAFSGQKKMEKANESFTHELLDNERALNVAVGTGWCAVTTSKGFLRIFSSTGVQMNVFWLKGPPVTMIGSGTQLAVFYNGTQPMNGTVQVRLELFSIFWDRPNGNRCIVSDQSVPLTKNSTLAWVGFETDSQLLTIIDSAEMMSMLMKPLGWQWMPVMDINKSKKSSDHQHWPIMVKKDKMAYILLNGESKPAIYPQPTVTTKPINNPQYSFILMESKKNHLENERSNNMIMAQTIMSHFESQKVEEDVFGLFSVEPDMSADALDARFKRQETEADKTVLKMLQSACRSHNIAKAFDLAFKLRTDKALQAGTQIANKLGRPEVAQKLDELYENRFALQEQEDEYQEEEVYASSAKEYKEPSVDRQHNTPSQKEIREDYDQDAHYGGGEDSQNIESDGNDQETTISSQQVTPAESNKTAVNNPFLKVHQSPVKRKNHDIDDLKDLKASPSPSKKPLLSRQSSFTESSRQHLAGSSFL